MNRGKGGQTPAGIGGGDATEESCGLFCKSHYCVGSLLLSWTLTYSRRPETDVNQVSTGTSPSRTLSLRPAR